MPAYWQDGDERTLIGETEEFLALNSEEKRIRCLLELNGGVDDLITLDNKKQASHYLSAKLAASRAVHDYCDALGIGDDEEGQQKRINFAQALHLRIIRGKNLHKYGRNLDIDKLIEEELTHSGQFAEVSQEDIQHFLDCRSYDPSTIGTLPKSAQEALQDSDSAEPLQDATEATVTRRNFNPIRALSKGISHLRNKRGKHAEIDLHAEDTEMSPQRRYGRVTKAIAGLTVTAVVLVSGAALLRDKESGNLEASMTSATRTERTTTTSTSTTLPPSTTTTLPIVSPETSVDVIDESTVDQALTEDELFAQSTLPEIGEDTAVEVIDVPAGGNYWNSVQELAMGTHGKVADDNQQLELVIGETLPNVSAANGGKNLSKIGAGIIVVPKDVAERFRAAGVGSIG